MYRSAEASKEMTKVAVSRIQTNPMHRPNGANDNPIVATATVVQKVDET